MPFWTPPDSPHVIPVLKEDFDKRLILLIIKFDGRRELKRVNEGLFIELSSLMLIEDIKYFLDYRATWISMTNVLYEYGR